MSDSYSGTILITGGTSGLGLGLVKVFLEKGYEVVATGRNHVSFPGYIGKFTFLKTDFCDLGQTSCALKQICEHSEFDIVINNAGILSPPDFILTDDRLEYTFQVNFLSHLLLNEIILRHAKPGSSIKIAAVVSPVYRIAEKDLIVQSSGQNYSPLKAYSNSKLCLALMCSYLPLKYPSLDLKCIGFDPGVFSSGIYRMQNEWFRILYRIASPFMRKPDKIADRLFEIIRSKDLVNGAVYNSDRRTGTVTGTDTQSAGIFWHECNRKIEPYLK